MPEKSFFEIDIPETDLLTYVTEDASDEAIWIDAKDTRRSLSTRQLLQWTSRMGFGLTRLGLKQNDVVLVFSTNHIFMPVAYFGSAGNGFVFSGCNPTYGPEETKFQIQNTGAKIMLVEPSLLDVALKAADKANFPHSRMFLFSDQPCQPRDGIEDWSGFLGSEEEAARFKRARLSPKEVRSRVAVLNYSSGTTGLPKGVCISHHNVIANVEQSVFMRQLSSADASSHTPMSAERWLGFLPLYHAYGQLWSIVAAAKTKVPVYFMRTFEFSMFLENVQAHRITHIQTAPPVLVMLAKRPETKEYDLSSLRNITCGAAPLSAELQNEIASSIGTDMKVTQTMGMTELTCSTVHVPGLMSDDSGSVGLADPNCEIKLVKDDGTEAGDDERGELCVKGPNVCLGYWKNEAATKDSFDEQGFLKSGDIAVRRKGWYWIVDRKKELIKVKGFQVAPAELEALLLEHEDVSDAAVVALQMDHEERPRAYVSLKDHARGKVNGDDIVKWTAQRVAKHKQLTGGVQLIDQVPKSPSGKIQRVVLRDWAKRDAQALGAAPKAKL